VRCVSGCRSVGDLCSVWPRQAGVVSCGCWRRTSFARVAVGSRNTMRAPGGAERRLRDGPCRGWRENAGVRAGEQWWRWLLYRRIASRRTGFQERSNILRHAWAWMARGGDSLCCGRCLSSSARPSRHSRATAQAAVTGGRAAAGGSSSG